MYQALQKGSECTGSTGSTVLVFCVADNFKCNVSVTSTNISKYTNSLCAVCHTVCLLARGTDAVFSGERKE